MTPMRWLIAAFWVFVIVMCAKSFYDYNNRLEHEEAAQEEKHYFAPGMVPTPAPAPADAAPDVRMTGWHPHEDPQAAQFTAELVIKNVGQKKATDIQVRIQPYVTSVDSSRQVGPDELLNPTTTDTMATYYQWIEFPDLGPGESATNNLTFPVRPDAQPREHFEAKILFDTPKANP